MVKKTARLALATAIPTKMWHAAQTVRRVRKSEAKNWERGCVKPEPFETRPG